MTEGDEYALIALKARRGRVGAQVPPAATGRRPTKTFAPPKPRAPDYATKYIAAQRRENPRCRHCEKALITRPRRLCWGCYYAPGVRELYPSTSKYARRGLGNTAGGLPLPPEPTTAAPGTPEKMAAMGQRAKDGYAIFHPADARHEGDPLPLEFIARQRVTA